MTEWDDFEQDGKRLERIIKILFKHLKKAKSEEKIIRLSNAIGFNTSKKIEVAKIHHDIQSLLDDMKEREKVEKRRAKMFR